jgi:hypothetical protein
MTMLELDAETEAWLDRIVDAAPPFSPEQERVIMDACEAAEDGAVTRPKQGQ